MSVGGSESVRIVIDSARTDYGLPVSGMALLGRVLRDLVIPFAAAPDAAGEPV